ncbi:MAG: hypothetical protein RIB98_09995 [Acidimicrobiales bacterium]
MNEPLRARPGSVGAWDRARRAYVAMLGDADPAAALVAAGALDLRLGHDSHVPGSHVFEIQEPRVRIFSAPDDLRELREIVETATGVGTWPAAAPVSGEPIERRIELFSAAPLLALLVAMDGLIERRSPWGRWRTMVDTMASRVGELDAVTVSLVVQEPT